MALVLPAVLVTMVILHYAIMTNDPRYGYCVELPLATSHMLGATLAFTAVYIGIPTPFGTIGNVLPASSEASFEGPDGWPCYLKRHFEAVLEDVQGDGVYDAAAIATVRANVRSFVVAYVLCIVVPMLLVRIAIVADRKSSRMAHDTYSFQLVDVGKEYKSIDKSAQKYSQQQMKHDRASDAGRPDRVRQRHNISAA